MVQGSGATGCICAQDEDGVVRWWWWLGLVRGAPKDAPGVQIAARIPLKLPLLFRL